VPRFLRSPLFWIGLAISVGAGVLAFRGLRWGEVRDAMVEANYGLLALAVVIMLVSLYFRAERWRVLFLPQRGLRLTNLLGAMSAGYALNNLLPLRVGEFARAYLIGEAEEDVRAPHALSTIVVERTLDTLTVVAMLLVTLPFIDAPGWARGPALFFGLGVLVLAVALALVSTARERAVAIVVRLERLLPERWRGRAESWTEAALEGFAVLRTPSVLARAAGWSAVSWLTSAVMIYVTLRAFGLDLPFSAALFVTAAVSLGMVVPSSPGYIGVFHAIAIESLVNVFDVERDPAASFALVQHAIQYLVPIVIGVAYLWHERAVWRRVPLSGLGDATRAEAAPAEPAD